MRLQALLLAGAYALSAAACSFALIDGEPLAMSRGRCPSIKLPLADTALAIGSVVAASAAVTWGAAEVSGEDDANDGASHVAVLGGVLLGLVGVVVFGASAVHGYGAVAECARGGDGDGGGDGGGGRLR